MAEPRHNPGQFSDTPSGAPQMMAQQRVEQRTSTSPYLAQSTQLVPSSVTAAKDSVHPYQYIARGSSQGAHPAPAQDQPRLIDVNMYPNGMGHHIPRHPTTPKDNLSPLAPPSIHPPPGQSPTADRPPHPPFCPDRFIAPYRTSYIQESSYDFQTLWEKHRIRTEHSMSILAKDAFIAGMHALSPELERLKRENERVAQVDLLLKEKEQWRHQRLQLEKDCVKLQGERDQTSNYARQLQAQMQTAVEAKSQYQSRIGELQDQNDSYKDEVKRMETELKRVIHDMERLNNVNISLKDELDQKSNELAEAVEQVQREIKRRIHAEEKWAKVANLISAHPSEDEIDSDTPMKQDEPTSPVSEQDMDMSDSDIDPRDHSTVVGSPPAPTKLVKEELFESPVPISPLVRSKQLEEPRSGDSKQTPSTDPKPSPQPSSNPQSPVPPSLDPKRSSADPPRRPKTPPRRVWSTPSNLTLDPSRSSYSPTVPFVPSTSQKDERPVSPSTILDPRRRPSTDSQSSKPSSPITGRTLDPRTRPSASSDPSRPQSSVPVQSSSSTNSPVISQTRPSSAMQSTDPSRPQSSAPVQSSSSSNPPAISRKSSLTAPHSLPHRPQNHSQHDNYYRTPSGSADFPTTQPMRANTVAPTPHATKSNAIAIPEGRKRSRSVYETEPPKGASNVPLPPPIERPTGPSPSNSVPISPRQGSLSWNNIGLLYADNVNATSLVCKTCLTEKISTPISFPKDATWSTLRDHYKLQHSTVLEKLNSMKPNELIELSERQKQANSLPAQKKSRH